MLSNTPTEVFLTPTQLYEEREMTAFNIIEATLVLGVYVRGQLCLHV